MTWWHKEPSYQQAWVLTQFAQSTPLPAREGLEKSFNLAAIQQATFKELIKTHWGLVTPFSDTDLGQHWLR